MFKFQISVFVLCAIGCAKQDVSNFRSSDRSDAGSTVGTEGNFELLTAAQLAAKQYLCEPVSGLPKSYEGSGACAGNVFIRMDLSNLFPDLALYYNSTWFANYLGFGTNITLSDMSIMYSNWLQMGDGSYIYLQRPTTGIYAGKLVAIDRSETSAVTETSGTMELKQKDMHGSVDTYTKLPSGIFALTASANRFAEVTNFKIDQSNVGESIKYSDGVNLTVTRTSQKVVIRRDSLNTATLTLDSSNRLVRLVINTESQIGEHVFTYTGTTARVASYRFIVDGKEIQANQFIYDDLGRLQVRSNSDGTSTRYLRNFLTRTVETVEPDGTILEEKFAADGKINSMRQYVAGNDEVPTLEMAFGYTSNGAISKITAPRGRTEYDYSASDPLLPIRSREYMGDVLINQSEYTVDPDTWLSSKDFVTGKSGQLESWSNIKWTSQWPYLPLAIEDVPARTCTTFTYSGNQTTVQYFRAVPQMRPATGDPGDCRQYPGIKVNEQVYNVRNLIQQTDPSAPTDQRVTSMTYGGRGNLVKVTSGSKITEYAYDSAERVVWMKDSSGIVTTFTYDATSSVATKTTKYPTGLQLRESYTRTYHPDGSVEKVTRAVELPNSKAETYEYLFADKAGGLKLGKVTKNGIEM